MTSHKVWGIFSQLIAYTLAIVAAVIVYQQLPEMHIVYKFLIANVAATLIIFVFSRLSGNSSFYDPYWSLQPIVILYFLYRIFSSPSDLSIRELLVSGIVLFWGLRLTFNFLRGWKGLSEQDWRYDDLNKKHGKNYWWVSFSGIHMFPTLLVFAGCLSLFAIFYPPVQSFGILDIIAAFIGVLAVLIEAIADQQLHRFKKTNKTPGKTFKSGLWSKVRHPNYLGEIGFWWSLYLFGLSANPAYWWSIIGPLSITLLFVYISIPMIDERMRSKRSDYNQHMEETPALIPKLNKLF